MMENMEEAYLLNILNKKSDILTASKDVTAEIIRLKKNLHKIIVEHRINLKPLEVKNESLTHKTLKLEEKAKTLDHLINVELREELTSCLKDVSHLSEVLEDMKISLPILDKIIHLQSALEATRKDLNTYNFYSCFQNLQIAKHLSEECQSLQKVESFAYFLQESTNLQEELLCNMRHTWDKGINFFVERNGLQRIVSFHVDKETFHDIKNVIQAAYHINDDSFLPKLFIKIKEQIVLPLIQYECTQVIETTKECEILVVTINEDSEVPYYSKVFEQLITVINFFRTHLQVDIPGNGDFVTVLGQSIAKETMSCLMRHNLSQAISDPYNPTENFEEIVADAEIFQKTLQKLGFYPDDFSDNSAGSSSDVEIFFENLMHSSYLDRARTIMKKELHSQQLASAIEMPNWDIFPPEFIHSIKQQFKIGQGTTLLKSIQISKSAQDILDLVNIIVYKLMEGNDDHSSRLLDIVRNIFEMYSAIIPLHHKKFLDTLPQQVALFHNNCLHFSYQILFLMCKCRTSWPIKVQDRYHVFQDQALNLRQLAINSLETCVSNQRSQIIANLRDSGFSKIGFNQKLDPAIESSFRLCIRQLELLKNVWMDVLPETVYSNSIGFLIDSFTEAIVSCISQAEDISAKNATQLVRAFTIVDDRIPKLLHDRKEVYRICRKWNRFRELIFVLESNLDSFSERWANGCGPLAHSFTKIEAANFVRALFKNTERRAALLSQISLSHLS